VRKQWKLWNLQTRLHRLSNLHMTTNGVYSSQLELIQSQLPALEFYSGSRVFK